jgi:hypothetical protein
LQVEKVQLDSMTGFEFEEFVAALLAKLGYGRVEKILPGQGKSRDILVRSSTGLIVVECSHHPKGDVGSPAVQKLHSSVVSSNGMKGILVTTGHFTRDAVTLARQSQPPIELIDWSGLVEMGVRARIAFVSGSEKLAIWTYSLPNIELTRSSLGEYVDSILLGHPEPASALLNLHGRTVRYQPIYLVTYDLNSVFATTVGVIHRENAQHANLALDGTNGQPVKEEDVEFFNRELETEFYGPTNEFSGELAAFRLDATSVRNTVKDTIANLHTRNVTYKARRNNRIYEKMCRPNERDIIVTDIRQFYLPSLIVNFSVLETNFVIDVLQTATGRILIRADDINLCRICNSRINSSGMVCNTCGRSAHSGGFFAGRVHGFRCAHCKKTTCRFDGHWTRRLVFLKALLCPGCASEEQEKGRNVKKLMTEKP